MASGVIPQISVIMGPCAGIFEIFQDSVLTLLMSLMVVR